MLLSHSKLALWLVATSSLTFLATFVSSAHGQGLLNRQPKWAPQPELCPPASEPTKPLEPGQAPIAPFLPPEQAVASVGESFAGAPNMIGDFLRRGNSTSFFYQRSQGPVFIVGTGSASTSIISRKISENNSPVPQDRVSFSYNYFSSALSVTGDSGMVVPAPDLGFDRLQRPRFRSLLASKTYNEQDYTIFAEKTFLDRLASVEMRLPFARTLSRDLDLSVARVVDAGNNRTFGNLPNGIVTSPTPTETLGHSSDELGNMSLILKGLLFESPVLAVSAGAGLVIPTARANHVRVVDFIGADFDNSIAVERLREFTVENETWITSPYFAVLAKPTSRCFVQSFVQFDVPLNKSRIFYSESPLINRQPFLIGFDALSFRDSIREQSLMYTDLGIGYWLVDRPEATWLTGIAPTVELHYTTSVNHADVRTMPIAQKPGPNGPSLVANEPNPQIGSLRSRLDILNLTLGTTFEIAHRATVATAVVIPLSSSRDRTFDFEFQLQLNYFFGPRSQFARR